MISGHGERRVSHAATGSSAVVCRRPEGDLGGRGEGSDFFFPL